MTVLVKTKYPTYYKKNKQQRYHVVKHIVIQKNQPIRLVLDFTFNHPIKYMDGFEYVQHVPTYKIKP